MCTQTHNPDTQPRALEATCEHPETLKWRHCVCSPLSPSLSPSHTHTHTYTKLHTPSLFPNSLTPPLHTHYFSSLEKLNGVKLSVGPSVSWVFGRDEKDSERWEEHEGERLEGEKGKGGDGVRSINMNHQQNPTADPSVAVHRPETIHSLGQQDIKRWMGGKRNTCVMHEFLSASAHRLRFQSYCSYFPITGVQVVKIKCYCRTSVE